jgi:hypothetical protein
LTLRNHHIHRLRLDHLLADRLLRSPCAQGEVVAEPDPLFFPPGEILEAIAKQVDPAAGTSGLLLAGLERLMDPLLVNPPFSSRDAP